MLEFSLLFKRFPLLLIAFRLLFKRFPRLLILPIILLGALVHGWRMVDAWYTHPICFSQRQRRQRWRHCAGAARCGADLAEAVAAADVVAAVADAAANAAADAADTAAGVTAEVAADVAANAAADAEFHYF